MICLYHADDDGKCAGWIVNCFTQQDESEKYFIEVDYNRIINYDKLVNDLYEDEYVYIVDFSIDPKDMRKILSKTKNVIWIDHHKTAIDKYKDFEEEIRGIRDINHSGSMLCWKYFNADLEPPLIVKLVDDYDMWRFRYQETKQFHEGFLLIDHDPDKNYNTWRDLCYNEIRLKEIIRNGDVALQYRKHFMNEGIESYGFESTIDGHTCFVFNQCLISSTDFESKIPKGKYEVLVAFVFDGNNYVYSLRTDRNDIDVSEIAKNHGGGGHKQAAGFTSKQLITTKHS